MKKKLFIIDGNSLTNRAYYALPLLADSNGVYSNAVFGFVNCMIKLMLEHKPDYIVVAFDHSRKTFRNEIFDMYKGTRKAMPDELRSQFPILKNILSSMNIKYIEQAGIEADDIIGTLCKRFNNLDNIVITGDRDSLQLVDENTRVWLTQKGISDIKEVNIKNIKELYGLSPKQVIDYKALAGDSSDNIPGVSGIGDKTALSLIEKYGSIDGIYQNLDNLSKSLYLKLLNGTEKCKMSYKLATIKTDCDVNCDLEECTYDFPFGRQTRKYFEEYSFRILLKKDFLFLPEALVDSDIVEIKEMSKFREIISNFSGDIICFDFRDKISFGFDNKYYSLSQDVTLFNLDPIDTKLAIDELRGIITDPNILKIVPDLKAHMHILKTNDIKNVFDINLAHYLISGGNKVEKKISVTQFFALYKKQKEEIEQKRLSYLYYEIELPLEYVLFDMEQEGFKLDLETLKELKISYGVELEKIETEIKSFSPNKDINIRSAKQLSEFLFNDLKFPDKGNKKHSTGVEVLTELIDYHPIVPLILRYRKVQKLYSGYILPYIEMIDKEGIIKTIFNQTQTATGRLSSSEPNLQNIPVRDEEGKNLRKIFVSRFDGGSIISADYNQIELRLLANLSKDPALISDYNGGIDIHRLTASKIFNKPVEQVNDFERRTAKAVNFGIIYGISSFGLSKNIDVSVKEAKDYIDLYFEKYPKVKQYLDGLIGFARENGYVKTVYNRFRAVPEISSSNGATRVFGERVAMNMPLQGTASDIIKMAMIRVYNQIQSQKLNSKLILQIHDELIVDVYPGEEKKIEEILVAQMQDVYKAEVPLIVSVGNGKTWYDCK